MPALLSLETKLSRNPEIFASTIDNEVVMMDETTGLYFGLNAVAGTIWSMLEKPISVEVLVAELLQKFNVSAEQCLDDIRPFLHKMLEHKLITITQTK